jgi:hypothetical protein
MYPSLVFVMIPWTTNFFIQGLTFAVPSALLPRRVRPHRDLDRKREDHGMGCPHDKASETDRMVHPPMSQAGIDATRVTEGRETVTTHRVSYGFTKRGNYGIPALSQND